LWIKLVLASLTVFFKILRTGADFRADLISQTRPLSTITGVNKCSKQPLLSC
jgi:hypothetical protein